MFYYPVTSAFVGICLNMTFLVFVVFLSWCRYVVPDSMDDDSFDHDQNEHGEEKNKARLTATS